MAGHDQGLAALLRGLRLFGLWLVIGGGAAPADLAVGAAAAAFAAWVSLRLLPPSGQTIRPLPVLRLGLGVIRASVTAGFDIARRALDPRLPVRPGLLAVALRLPAGPARDGFRLLASLQPRSLPVRLDAAGWLCRNRRRLILRLALCLLRGGRGPLRFRRPPVFSPPLVRGLGGDVRQRLVSCS